MIVNKAFKFRMYPNKEQEYLINTSIGSCRFIYNNFLDTRIKSYQYFGQNSNYYNDASELKDLKKIFDWLKLTPSDALQQTLKDLDKAFKNFFKLGNGFPKFKSKYTAKLSYKCVSRALAINEKTVSLPKLGKVKIKQSFNLPKDIKINNATISKTRSGKYFVSFSCEVEAKAKPQTNKEVGIDLGLTTFATLSDGFIVENQRFTKKFEAKLFKAQRKLSKMVKGSNNKYKQRIKVARIHEKIANQRKDFLQRVTTMIVSGYDLISIEDLSVESMLKDHKLAKHVSDVSFAEFRRQLTYKCQWYGKELKVINRWFPSSKTCSSCENVKADLHKYDRTYNCNNCGTILDRDYNAALNILTQGKLILA